MVEKYLLKMENIVKNFPGTQALKSVNLEVEAGEIHGIMGHNGAGKSTLMNILGGIFMPDDGNIIIEGKPIVIRDPGTAIELGIRMVHQELSQFPNMTVMENLFINKLPKSRFGTINWKKLKEISKKRLEMLGLEKLDLEINICDLSIGNRQLIEIAKEVEEGIKILILDEPTSALGFEEVDTLFSILNKLKKDKNLVILYISHRIDEVLQIANRITVLRDGKNVGTVNANEVTHGDLVQMIVDKNRVKHINKKERKISQGKVLLKVENLTSEKLKHVSFELREGEILGLVGLLGSGRTEILKTIFGGEKFYLGNILVNDIPLLKISPHDAMMKSIGFTPEDRKLEGLNMGLSIRENITLPIINNLKKIMGLINKQKEKALVSNYVSSLNIKTSGNEIIVNTLSGGNQQKVCIAKCLTKKPKIILMDDPTRGIDIGAKEEIFTIIENLSQEGAGIIFVSSEFPEILRVCDRILFVYKGQIIQELTQDEANQENMMFYATGGKQN